MIILYYSGWRRPKKNNLFVTPQMLIPQIKGKAVFIGYTGDENLFTCDAFYGTTEEAINYFSDENYFKIVLFSDLPNLEQEIVINCIPPAQMDKLKLYLIKSV